MTAPPTHIDTITLFVEDLQRSKAFYVDVFGLPVLWHLFNSSLPAQLDIWSIFLSLAVAVGVGVLFGWYPARRASRLDPIEALRHN